MFSTEQAQNIGQLTPMKFTWPLHASHIISLFSHSWIISNDNYIWAGLCYIDSHRGDANCSLVIHKK